MVTVGMYVYVYETVVCCSYTMLEGILYQRDENEGSNPQFRVFGHIDVYLYLSGLRNADSHQVDIAVDEFYLIV